MKFFFLPVLFFSSLLLAKEVPSRPVPVLDEADVLSRATVRQLSKVLMNFKHQTGNEVSVVTVQSLEDETIESYSLKIADQWKLGDREKDTGVLFLVAVGDRKMRIEVGQGLEGDLTDVESGRIIRSIKPYFKKGDYRSGIIFGLSQILEKTGGEVKALPRVSKRKRASPVSAIIYLIIFILFFFSGRGGRGGFLAGALLGGGLGRGSSGGGFGGFGGGGGFSGGGASGDW